MRPPPRSIIAGSASRQVRYVPSTLTSRMRHHSSRSVSHDSSQRATPAFATSKSSGSAVASIRSTSSRFETSPTTASPPSSRATSSTCSIVRALTVTCQPAAVSSRAIPAPMPRPPPVTNALDGICDLLQGLGVLQGRHVARILAERLRPHGAADDLRTAGLGQRRDEQHPLRRERLPEHGCDRGLDAFRILLGAGLQRAEDPGRLALHLVRNADRR